MNELELIARLTRNLPLNDSVVQGAGDDCAVIDLGLPKTWLLLKTDAVVEGIHFTAETPPELIGHKALARCLSDIAAMAGRPNSALVTIATPADFEVERLEAIYRGFNALAKSTETAVVGGEITTNPERLLISVAVLGTVEPERCTPRTGARPGDAIFVSGELGGSISGKHLDFTPRLAEARWLADRFPVSSMIDVSDGLATDLRHLLEASAGGAELLSDAVPISRAARLRSRSEASSKPPLQAALTDGEDFELLFTLPSKMAVPLHDAWCAEFPDLKLSCIGKVTAKKGLLLRNRTGNRPLDLHGYDHFA